MSGATGRQIRLERERPVDRAAFHSFGLLRCFSGLAGPIASDPFINKFSIIFTLSLPR